MTRIVENGRTIWVGRHRNLGLVVLPLDAVALHKTETAPDQAVVSLFVVSRGKFARFNKDTARARLSSQVSPAEVQSAMTAWAESFAPKQPPDVHQWRPSKIGIDTEELAELQRAAQEEDIWRSSGSGDDDEADSTLEEDADDGVNDEISEYTDCLEREAESGWFYDGAKDEGSGLVRDTGTADEDDGDPARLY